MAVTMAPEVEPPSPPSWDEVRSDPRFETAAPETRKRLLDVWFRKQANHALRTPTVDPDELSRVRYQKRLAELEIENPEQAAEDPDGLQRQVARDLVSASSRAVQRTLRDTDVLTKYRTGDYPEAYDMENDPPEILQWYQESGLAKTPNFQWATRRVGGEFQVNPALAIQNPVSFRESILQSDATDEEKLDALASYTDLRNAAQSNLAKEIRSKGGKSGWLFGETIEKDGEQVPRDQIFSDDPLFAAYITDANVEQYQKKGASAIPGLDPKNRDAVVDSLVRDWLPQQGMAELARQARRGDETARAQVFNLYRDTVLSLPELWVDAENAKDDFEKVRQLSPASGGRYVMNPKWAAASNPEVLAKEFARMKIPEPEAERLVEQAKAMRETSATRAISALLGAWYREGDELRPYRMAFEGGIPAVSGPGAVIGEALNERLGVGAANFRAWYRKNVSKYQSDAELLEAYKAQNKGVFAAFNNTIAKIQRGVVNAPLQGAQVIGAGSTALFGKGSEFMETASGAMKDIREASSIQGGVPFIDDIATEMTWLVSTMGMGNLASRGVRAGAQAIAGRSSNDLFRQMAHRSVANLARDGNVGAAYARLFGFTEMGAEATGARIARRFGAAGYYGTAGARSAGAIYSDAFEDAKQEALATGASESVATEIARSKAIVPAIAAGLTTTLLMKLVPGGTEKVFSGSLDDLTYSQLRKQLSEETLRQGLRSSEFRNAVVKTLAIGGAREGGKEALEEGLDELAQSTISLLAYDPDLTLKEALENSLHGAIVGGLMGSSIPVVDTGVRLGRDYREDSAEARQQEIRKEQRQDELLDQAAANGAPLTAAAVESVIQQGAAQPTASAETAPEEAPPTAPPTTSAAEAPMPDTDDVKGMQTALEEVDAEIAATEAQKAEADARDPLSDEADEIDAKLAQLHAKKDFLAEQLGVLDADEDAQPDTTAQEDQIPGVAEEPTPEAQTTPTQTTDENRTESSPRPSPEPDRKPGVAREQAQPRPAAAGEPAAPAGPRTDAGTERGVTEQAAPEPSTPATPSEGTAPAPASEAPETTPQEPEETGGVSPTISPTPQQPPAPAPPPAQQPAPMTRRRAKAIANRDPQSSYTRTEAEAALEEYREAGNYLTTLAQTGDPEAQSDLDSIGESFSALEQALDGQDVGITITEDTADEAQSTETQRPAAPAEPAPPAEPAAQPQPQPAPEPAAGGAEVQPGSGEAGGTGDRDAAAGPGQADAGTTGGVRRQVSTGRPEPIVVGAGNLPEPRSDVAFDKYSSVSGFKLSPDQELGVRLIVDSYSGGNPGFLLGDGTGYGKTAQIVVAANEIANRSGKPVLIVTQNAEIIKNRFKPEMEALGIPTDGLIEITTYAQTRAKNRKLKHDRYEAVLLDEAHNVRNSDSKQSRAVAAISRGFTVYATATPMDTPEGAAYFMAEILGRSEEEVAAELGLEPYYKTDKDTKQQVRHWRLKARQFTHADFLDNLNRLRHEGVRKGGYLRRVFPFWGTVIVDSDHQLNSEQLDIEQEGISAWDEIVAEKGPRTRGQAALEHKKWAELEKLDIVFDKVRQQLSQGRKVVVFVETNENANLKGYPTSPTQERMGMPGAGLGAMLMKRLEDAGIRAVSFTGNKSAAKDAKYDAFQKKNTADVLVTTPQSGSTGIDLDDQLGDLPRHAIMATPNFSGNTFDQAVGRVSRRNSKSPATFEVVAFSNAVGDIHSAGTLRAKIRTLTAIQGGDPDAVDFGALTEAMDAMEAEKEKGKGGSKQPKLPPTFPITGLNWVPAGAGKFTVVLDPEANPEVSEAAVRQFWKWWRANKAEFKQNDAYVRTVKDPTTGQSYWTAGIPERYLNQLQATQPAPTPPEAVVSAPEATASVTPEQRTIEASQEFPNKPPSETPEVQTTDDTPPPPRFTALEETRRTEEPAPPKEEKKPKKARGAIRILSGAERATIVNSGIYYDTAQLQQAFGLGTNKAKSTAAELEAEMAVKYPPQEPPPGNYKTVEEKDGGPRGKNIYRVYVDRTSGARQPRFSNNTFETAKQLSRDERIVVPSDIPLNPAISVDENNVVTRVKVPFDAEGNAVTPDKAIEVGRPGRGILTFDELWPRVVADKTEGQLRRGAEAEQTGKNLGKNMFLDSMVTVPYTLDVLRGFGMETGDPEQVALKHFESVFDNQATQANTPPENKDRARVKALNEVIEWLRLAKVQSRFALIRGGLDADSTLTQEQKDARFVETVDKIFPADFHDYLAKRRLGSNTKEGRVLAFEAYLNDRAERNDFEKDIRSWVSHIISVQLEQKAGRKKGLSAATISTEALGDDPGAVDRELDETRRDEIDEAPVVELKPEDPEQVRREEAARTLKLHGYTGSPHADDPAKLTEYEIGLAEIYRSFQLYVDNAMMAAGRPSPGIISAEMMDQHLVKPIPITKKFWGQFPVESETAQKLYDEFFDNLQEQDSRNADAVRVDETVTRQIEAENAAEAGRLGLKNNEAETAKAALVQIAQDRNQPAHLRTAARLILTARPNFSGFTFDLIRDPREDFSGRFSPAGSPTAAPGGGPVVTLNLSKRGGRGLVDTLVHELLHYTLDDILTNPRNETERRLAADLNKHRLRVAQAFARANAGFDDFIALWKRVIADEVDSKTDGQVVYEIATSRSPLAKSYKSDMTPAEKRELLFTIKGEEYGAMDVVNRHADLQYALFGKEGAPADYALKEFVTHLLTDPKLQSFMQRVGVEYTKSNGDTYRLFQGPAWQIALRNFGRFLTGQPGSIGQEFTNALDRVANLRDAGRLRNAYQSSAQAGVLRTRLEALVQAVGREPQQQPARTMSFQRQPRRVLRHPRLPVSTTLLTEDDQLYLRMLEERRPAIAREVVLNEASESGYDVEGFHATFSPRFVSFAKERLGRATGAASAKKAFFFSQTRETGVDYVEAAEYDASVEPADPEQLKKLASLIAHIPDDKTLWEFHANLLSSGEAIESNASDEELTELDQFEEEERDKFVKGSPETRINMILSGLLNDFTTVTDLASLSEFLVKRGILTPAQIASLKLARPRQFHVFLRLQNPLIHDFEGKTYREVTFNDLLKKARRDGHDGVIFKNVWDGGPVADPRKIQSLDSKRSNIASVERGLIERKVALEVQLHQARLDYVEVTENSDRFNDDALIQLDATDYTEYRKTLEEMNQLPEAQKIKALVDKYEKVKDELKTVKDNFRTLIDDPESVLGPRRVENIYAVFEPTQIKSAATVTRDEKGRIIPPSHRFDGRRRSIQYSRAHETTNFTPPKDLRTGRPTTVPGAGEAHPDSLEEIRRSLAKRRFAEAKGFSELTSGGGTARPALPTVDLTSFGWGKPADVLANEGRDFMVNDIGMPATSVTPKELRSYVYGIGRDFYATPRVLDRVGKGSESVVFEDRDNPGVVWKFVSDNDFDPRSGWGLAFNPGANGFAGLTESRQERTIFDRIKVLERLGTPTEIVGTVERLNDLVLKQPQLDTSNIDPFEHVDDLGIDTNGVIMFQPPIGVVSNYAGTQNSYIVFVDGKFYLMADVRGANVGIDASGNVRILDPVIQEIPDYMVQSKEHKQFFADARKAQEDADRKRAEFESPDEQLSISAEGSLGAYHEFHAAQTFREAESIVLRGLEKVDPLVADEARAGFKELGYDNLDESDFRRLLADSAFHLLRNSSGESPIEGALPPALRESVGAILYAGVEEMQSIRDSGPPADGLRAARILTKVTDFRDGVDTEVSGLQNARAQWMRWDYPKRPEMSFLGESFVDPALYGTLGGSFGKDFKRWLTKEGKWGKEFFPIYVERQAGLKAISLSAELIERELRRLINKAKKSGNPVSTKVLNAALGTTTETADPNTLTAVKATFKTAKGDIFRDYMQQLKAAKALGRAGNFPASALRRRRAELVRKLKFEKAKQQYKDDLRQAYDRGAVQFRRRQAAAQAKLAKEHPEIYKAILKLRKQIDSLSMMVSRVAPDKDVEAKILGNLGVYLRRTYEWWDKSDYRKWLATADPEAAKIADAARKYFRNELVRENANAYIDAQAAHGNIIPFPQAVARAETMVTEDEVIKRLETWVHQLGNRAPEAYMGFLSKEIFLEKENIPLELREFLGVYDDNVFNATRTLSSLSEHMLNYGFLDSLKQQLTEIQNNLNAGKPLSEHEILITDDAEVARRRGLVPFVPSDKEKTVAKDAYGPLAGYYGPELLVEATHELRPVDFSALSRFARQAVGYSMAAKTVYSWRTHIRNFLGNPMFMLYSGNFSLLNPSGWSDLRTSMNSTIRMGKKSEPEIREFLVELAQLGVTSDNVDLNLIRELATSAREGDSAFARKMSPTIKKFAEAAARKAKARAKEAEELYSAEDDFWKIMIYLNELRRHATAFGVSDLTDAQQLTNAQADRILAVLPPKTPAGKNIVDKKERALFALKKGVADKSRAVTPHYSTTFEFIRQAKRHGLTTFVAPFVSFQAEVVRLTGANWALVKQEFAVPELRSIAIKRAGGALTAMTAGSLILKTLAGGLAWAFKSIAGGDDDELKDVDFLDMVFNTRLEADIRRFLPSYYKWNDIAIIGRTKTGSYLWLDISWMNPFSVLKKPVNAFFKNEDKGAGAAIQEAGMTAIEPYLSPQIWLKALFDQSATEQRAELMKDFDDAPALTAAKAMWNVFVGLAVPQTFVDLNKVRETIGKDIDRGRDVSTVTEAASFLFGAKVNTLDPYRQLEFRSLPQRRDQLREAEMIFNRPFRTESETTAEAMQEAYLQAQDARRRVLAATRHDVMAVGRLTGDPRGTLQILANSRLGNAEEQMVIGNVYQRWRPSNLMVERAARAQRSVGDSRIQDFLRYMDTVPEYNSLEDPIEPVSGEE